MHTNDNPTGSASDYRFAIFNNIDKLIHYNKQGKGKLLIVIMIDETDHFSYKFIDWEKGKEITHKKIFQSKYPKYTSESW